MNGAIPLSSKKLTTFGGTASESKKKISHRQLRSVARELIPFATL